MRPGPSPDDTVRVKRDWRQVVASGVSAVSPVLLLVSIFAVMQRWASSTLLLPEDAYRSPVLALEVARALATPRGLVGLGGLFAVAVLRPKEVLARWSALEGGNGVRSLVLIMVVWATWTTVTSDHNLFYGQSYDLDRVVLVVLAALACWRPAFVIPHLFLFIAFEHQFDHPFARQIFARTILQNLLLLFSASLLVQGITRRQETRTFLFVACALLASYYWYPGYVKLVRGWFSYGQLYLGGFASYANGWLAALPAEAVERFLRLAAWFDWPGRILTLTSELGALFFFAHRKAARVLLGTWAALHLGIWLFSGISFLVWIWVDLAFLILFFRAADRSPLIFSRGLAIGGAALVLASPIWVRPPAVGWFDTRLVYTYRYEAVDERGGRAAFPADATPLGEAWCARDFPFLSEDYTLLVRYGKTNDRALADAIATIEGSPESVLALEASVGQIYFDAEQAREFDRYLGDIAHRWNERGSQRHALSWAAPPRTCLSPRSPPEPVIGSERTVRQIVVHRLTFLFDGQTFREIRRVVVRTIEIPG